MRCPGAGRPLDHPELDAALLKYADQVREVEKVRLTRMMLIQHAIHLDPLLYGYNQLAASPSATTAWLKRMYCYLTRWQKRYRWANYNVGSAGPQLPADFVQRAEAYEQRCIEARRQPDGSLLPPKAVTVFDQTPVTREVVGRKTLNRRGSRSTAVKTSGKEKERWTCTPIWDGDGNFLGATATFHGARRPDGRQPPKKGSVARELDNWRAHGYPRGFLYSCNKTAWFTFREAMLLFKILRFKLQGLAREEARAANWRPRTVTVCDAFSVHRMEPFNKELQQVPLTPCPRPVSAHPCLRTYLTHSARALPTHSTPRCCRRRC